MPDDFDRIQDNEARYQQDLEKHATAPKPNMVPVGVCHNCGEPVPGKLLFCLDDPTDPDCTTTKNCRDDLENRQALRKHNGG